MENAKGLATSASIEMSEGLVGGKSGPARVTVLERAVTPSSSRTSQLSVEEMEAAPTSFQTSKLSLVEKADATDTNYYLKGWRLKFLSLRSASLLVLLEQQPS